MSEPLTGVATDAGRVRSHNEDAYLVKPPFYAVADGMGGHAGGEIASRLALDSLAATLTLGGDGQDAVRNALTQANVAVYQLSSVEGPSHGMGTTCALLHIADGFAYVGHVGDSRIYVLRDNELIQLTRDHTVAIEMLDQGLLTEEQAMMDGSPGQLTRALGGSADVDVDVDSLDFVAGYRFLLCSDGLTAMVSDDDIRRILTETPNPQIAADRLVTAANAAGGNDNVTVLVVDPPPAANR